MEISLGSWTSSPSMNFPSVGMRQSLLIGLSSWYWHIRHSFDVSGDKRLPYFNLLYTGSFVNIRRHRRNELRPGAMKASPRTWYYIDFQRTIDNIKWKMFKIRKQIDDKLRNVGCLLIFGSGSFGSVARER